MRFSYQKICQDLFEDISERTKDVILRRFGLETGKRETLEAVGKDYGICRERVRQIEKTGLLKLKPRLSKYQEIFQYFVEQINAEGNLKREDLLLKNLAEPDFQNQVFFLLTLGDPFIRISETADFHPFWTINSNSLKFASQAINTFYNNILTKKNRPLILEEIKPEQIFGRNLDRTTINCLSSKALQSYLEISKKIQQNSEGFFGKKEWPEINPRGISDKAFLVFKKEKRPLHFSEVTQLIGENALIQTVHNELIRDRRFVLVGRGLYALKEWGYEPGVVKDIIVKILKETNKSLSREEIIEKVLKQRFVKENTISLNLSNKKYFKRTPEGKYKIK